MLAESKSENVGVLLDLSLIHLFFPTAHSLPWRLFLSLLLIKMRRKWRLEDFHVIFFGVLCLLLIDGGKLEQGKRKYTSDKAFAFPLT